MLASGRIVAIEPYLCAFLGVGPGPSFLVEARVPYFTIPTPGRGRITIPEEVRG